MTFTACTDGASRGNPGDSGIGLVVRDEAGDLVLSEYGYIGRATNNVAEYTALLAMLRRARRWSCSRLVIRSDSELMVRQISGDYKVRDEGLRPLYRKVVDLLERSPFPVEVRHIPRDENGEADRLANQGIDTRRKIRV